MTREEIDNTKYKVCCPVCENKICVKGTVSCEAEQWAKSQQGDAISRQAAIDAIEKTKAAMATDGEIYVAKINAEMNIQQLPSVSTEKTGRWEWVQYDFDPRIGNWHCSECRNIIVHAVKKDEVDGIPIANYCPHCGAKMEVE